MSSGSPRFLEAPDYANILDPQVTFSLRSHTTNISNCRVAKFTPRAGREKRVNCSISGSPPELLLTLPLHNQPWVEEGKWKLVIENELGTSETIITLSSSEQQVINQYNYHIKFFTQSPDIINSKTDEISCVKLARKSYIKLE